MTLPPINNTRPTEPPSFSVTPQINGTLLYDWTRPIVHPAGTEIQIIRSTNSANAAVGTVVWQGPTRPVALVMPTSTHWYYARSVANSAFSPFSPNTFGVAGKPYPPATNYYAYTIPDGGFDLSADMGHFWMPDSLSNALGVYSLSLTGGLTGGRMIMNVTTADGADIVFRHAFVNLFERVPLRVGPCRFRVTFRVSSVAFGSGGPFGSVIVGLRAWTGVSTPTPDNITFISGGNANMVSLITSAEAGVGNWFTYVGSGHIRSRQSDGAAFFDASSYPYAAFYVAYGPNASTFRGVIELDEVGFFFS